MNVPEWAQKAFDDQKPRAPAYPENAEPDPAALAHWRAYTDRFRDRWHELGVDKWNTKDHHRAEWCRYDILTAGLACAKRMAKGQTPAKIVQARKDILNLEREISELASQLASKFKLRDGMESDSGVASWRRQDFAKDPMDLWDAFELAFNPTPGSGVEPPRADVWRHLSSAINLARSTSLSVPEWPDLLRVLADHFECGTLPGEFPDITTMGHDTNRSEYSPWCKALIQMLDDLDALKCLTNAQLADLAGVALNAPADAINAKQIGDLKRKFKSTR